jgi:hypothetical protein
VFCGAPEVVIEGELFGVEEGAEAYRRPRRPAQQSRHCKAHTLKRVTVGYSHQPPEVNQRIADPGALPHDAVAFEIRTYDLAWVELGRTTRRHV